MAVRKPAAKAATRKPVATTKRTPAKEAAPTKAPGRDVTQYADKEPTDLHKTLARYIVTEAGYDPNTAASKREAFLMGVSIATAIRPVFQQSDFLAEWYEETGTPKRGRKPKGDDAEVTRKSKRAQVTDEEFEDATEEEPEEEEVEEVDLDELEAELTSMAIGPLRKAAKEEYELTLERGLTKKEIINAILDSLAEESEEDDDEDGEEEEIDLEELQAELEAMTPAEVKEAAEEYDITPKRGERKAALIDRIIQSLEAEEDEDGDAEEEEPEEVEEAPKRGAKSSARPTKASKEFLF